MDYEDQKEWIKVVSAFHGNLLEMLKLMAAMRPLDMLNFIGNKFAVFLNQNAVSLQQGKLDKQWALLISFLESSLKGMKAADNVPVELMQTAEIFLDSLMQTAESFLECSTKTAGMPQISVIQVETSVRIF
jgi:hypothetical protein